MPIGVPSFLLHYFLLLSWTWYQSIWTDPFLLSWVSLFTVESTHTWRLWLKLEHIKESGVFFLYLGPPTHLFPMGNYDTFSPTHPFLNESGVPMHLLFRQSVIPTHYSFIQSATIQSAFFQMDDPKLHREHFPKDFRRYQHTSSL